MVAAAVRGGEQVSKRTGGKTRKLEMEVMEMERKWRRSSDRNVAYTIYETKRIICSLYLHTLCIINANNQMDG